MRGLDKIENKYLLFAYTFVYCSLIVELSVSIFYYIVPVMTVGNDEKGHIYV